MSHISQKHFADKLSYSAYLYAVSKARDLQSKIDGNKDSILFFDEDRLTHPAVEITADPENIKIGITEKSKRCFFSIFGCETDDDGRPYSRKKTVDEIFSRISVYQKI